ncbi:MAG TPA: FtsW/RodA/SpoVE family cell cycle protein [Ktedonobacteraceae bacterium]|nr:FtsW/RodA/SpoVE family cell cycle protein [Ktedonobacteraceae bacterium]
MKTFLKNYRWKELGLFVIPFMILLVGMMQLPLAHFYETQLNTTTKAVPFSLAILPTVSALIPIIGLIVVLVIVNVVFSIFFPKADQILLPLVGLMSGIGVLMATRLQSVAAVGDPNLGTRQLVWVIVGLVVCILTLAGLRRMGWLRRYKYTWAALGILLVAVTLINAFRVRNLNAPTHDQLNFGPLNLQPSELLKIFIVIFFAGFLSDNIDVIRENIFLVGPFRLPLIGRTVTLRLPPLMQLGPIALMLGISLVLFLGIRELGLALLIYGIFLVMIYLGSGKLSYVVVSLIVFFVLGFIGYKLFTYVQDRFTALSIDPTKCQQWGPSCPQQLAQGSAFQILQGLIALSSGGILGTGIGLGHAGAFVPVVVSDMIFTQIGEELGLAGLFAIIGLYLLILYRGYRIAIEASDSFNQLLAAGLTSIFAIQSLIIILGNMKFLPLTGIPLPFLSYGGSSIIANYIIIGILLRISHITAVEREAAG